MTLSIFGPTNAFAMAAKPKYRRPNDVIVRSETAAIDAKWLQPSGQSHKMPLLLVGGKYACAGQIVFDRVSITKAIGFSGLP